jgi:hypothetical protein
MSRKSNRKRARVNVEAPVMHEMTGSMEFTCVYRGVTVTFNHGGPAPAEHIWGRCQYDQDTITVWIHGVLPQGSPEFHRVLAHEISHLGVRFTVRGNDWQRTNENCARVIGDLAEAISRGLGGERGFQVLESDLEPLDDDESFDLRRDEAPWETEQRLRELWREFQGLEEEDPPVLADEIPRRKGGNGR